MLLFSQLQLLKVQGVELWQGLLVPHVYYIEFMLCFICKRRFGKPNDSSSEPCSQHHHLLFHPLPCDVKLFALSLTQNQLTQRMKWKWRQRLQLCAYSCVCVCVCMSVCGFQCVFMAFAVSTVFWVSRAHRMKPK